ncbi:hypothetical protein BABINDRAFT_10742 [Babjeviella inositovora NRRL Y-12698]|uniref:Class II aldolase/adducin N-terminal domain-containing protein n=1 Tax=Babjeviella inositovora NRRL Y-12698 TaxID=984486 RepID=A0A1E3QX53_9ASCO|nr:uncharacterized protein BABINDRAFT_10742 [Babjeviella inositovora NRRL Y-12698]ODQ82279.1 hypothetical protein BABINDRAFT_10742 [Babjeviella inositovora NRRL Y-12698]
MSQTQTTTLTAPQIPSLVEVDVSETSRGYKVAERGSHNIALGGAHPFQLPVFEDKLEERKWIREHMAAAFRTFGRNGYSEGTAGHISVRDPIEPHTFWINPLGRHFCLMKASDMIRVDYDGNLIEGNAAINKAGFQIHSELHKYRLDINAACHTHSIHGKTYSAFGKPLEMLNQDSCTFYNCHSVFTDFGGVALESDEGKKIAAACGPNGRALILQNHGLLTVGQTVDEAAYLFTLMERTCQAQLMADAAAAGGFEKKVIGDEEAAYTYHTSADPETLFTEFQPEIELEEYLHGNEYKQ